MMTKHNDQIPISGNEIVCCFNVSCEGSRSRILKAVELVRSEDESCMSLQFVKVSRSETSIVKGLLFDRKTRVLTE